MKNERIGSHEVHPVASIFPLLEREELEALAADIKANGLREPILRLWVQDPIAKGTRKELILDGRNRLRACQRAAVPPTFENYEGATDTDTLLKLVRSKNLARRHLSESARAVVAARALTLYEVAAKERQRAGGAAGGRARGSKGSADVREPSPAEGKASERAAEDFGVSARLIEQAKLVQSKGAAEVKRAVERGELKVSAAAELVDLEPATQRALLEKARGKTGSVRALKRAHARQQQAEQLAREPLPPPAGPYRVLVADFPWPYESRNDDPTHRGTTPYAQLSIDEGCLMGERVQGLAHDDAALWFWTTNQHMREAFDIVAAWGFRQKTILTWEKDRMGLGNYLRNQTEHCLVCVRGKPVFNLTNQTTILRGAVREHSRKPDSFYDLVTQLTPGSTVELFSREARPGWAAWGAEVEKFARSA